MFLCPCLPRSLVQREMKIQIPWICLKAMLDVYLTCSKDHHNMNGLWKYIAFTPFRGLQLFLEQVWTPFKWFQVVCWRSHLYITETSRPPRIISNTMLSKFTYCLQFDDCSSTVEPSSNKKPGDIENKLQEGTECLLTQLQCSTFQFSSLSRSILQSKSENRSVQPWEVI